MKPKDMRLSSLLAYRTCKRSPHLYIVLVILFYQAQLLEAHPVKEALPVYVVISKPKNLITLSTIEKLQPAKIYVAYPPSEEQSIPEVEKRLKKRKGLRESNITWFPFDASASKEIIQKNVDEFVQMLESDAASTQQQDSANGKINTQKGDNITPKSTDPGIAGIMINPFGALDGNTRSTTSGLLPVVERKLISNLILLHTFLDRGLLKKKNSRIIFVGSEAARGLPKMGFPAPDLGRTRESILSYMTGTAYTEGEKSYSWEAAYAATNAMVIYYFRELSLRYPQHFFLSLSPGMTQASLDPSNAPNPTLLFKLQMFFFRYIIFGLLCRLEIARTVDDAAKLFAEALNPKMNKGTGTGDEVWSYPSGAFIAAKSGTGGPMCDQTLLEGGKIFLDRNVQKLVYGCVQEFIR